MRAGDGQARLSRVLRLRCHAVLAKSGRLEIASKCLCGWASRKELGSIRRRREPCASSAGSARGLGCDRFPDKWPLATLWRSNRFRLWQRTSMRLVRAQFAFRYTRWRYTGCLFHAPAPLRGRFGANERPSTYPHHCGRVATFRQVVEMCAADSVPAAELHDRECEHVRRRRLRGLLKFA